MSTLSRGAFLPQAALLALLCGCGGGGGGSIASAPPPVASPSPAPTPSPTPTPPAIPATDGPAGFYPLKQDSPLVAYAGGVSNDGNWPETEITAYTYGPDQVKIDYDPVAQDYKVQIPNYGEGRTVEDSPDNSTPSTRFRYMNIVGIGFLAVARKAEVNLSYTAIAEFGSNRLTPQGQIQDNMLIVTGIPTAANDIPRYGSASYSATVRGWGTMGTPVRGDLDLLFNFASTSLSGSMELSANDGTGAYLPLGRYQVTNGVHAVGSTTFSGNFALPSGLTGATKLEGQFMGPGAAEVGGSWQVPIRIPANSAIHPNYYGDWIATGVFAGARR